MDSLTADNYTGHSLSSYPSPISLPRSDDLIVLINSRPFRVPRCRVSPWCRTDPGRRRGSGTTNTSVGRGDQRCSGGCVTRAVRYRPTIEARATTSDIQSRSALCSYLCPHRARVPSVYGLRVYAMYFPGQPRDRVCGTVACMLSVMTCDSLFSCLSREE